MRYFPKSACQQLPATILLATLRKKIFEIIKSFNGKGL